MTTPATELRAAAEKLRKLVASIEAPDLPDQSWHTEECADDERGNCPCIVAQGTLSLEQGSVPMFYVADAETPECAAYIAAMGPPVALAMADWFIDEARRISRASSTAGQEIVGRRALAVARAINGRRP